MRESWFKRLLWNVWIPDYEGGGPWHLRWRASAMYWVRHVWFLGRQTQCVCGGCTERVAKASASGLCGMCAAEDCQHLCEHSDCDEVSVGKVNGFQFCEEHWPIDEQTNHICETKPRCLCSDSDDECCCVGFDVCGNCGARIVAIDISTAEPKETP